jgi:hypothetical protein
MLTINADALILLRLNKFQILLMHEIENNAAIKIINIKERPIAHVLQFFSL